MRFLNGDLEVGEQVVTETMVNASFSIVFSSITWIVKKCGNAVRTKWKESKLQKKMKELWQIMEYTEMLYEAIQKEELILFLKGEKEYNITPSQYTPAAEPTDVNKVLSKVIYKVYETDSSIKEEFEETLLIMLGETDYDVYVAVLYIMSELFKEKNGLSPFNINISSILPKLKCEVLQREESFKEGIVYSNGFVSSKVWDNLERFNHVCKEEYGIELF